MKRHYPYIISLLITFFCSCSSQKFIPEGEYLLDEVNITSDSKDMKPSLFVSYIRQNPNAKWFNLVKVPMHIYCASGQDSTQWLNRFLRKIGDAPVIYDQGLAEKSQQVIQQAVRNMGYMNAKVNLNKDIKKNKLKLNYQIKTGPIYQVNHIAYHIDDVQIQEIINKDSASSYLYKGMPFDVMVLDNERQRITKLLQGYGYYKFNKDFLVYQADTVKNTRQVDLTMKLLPYQRRKEDTPTKHQQYAIRNVNFIQGSSIINFDNEYNQYDSAHYKGINVYYNDKMYIRPNTLYDFNRIRPQDLYNEADVQDTYESLGRLRALKYANIRFNEITQNDSVLLDANIVMAKGKNKSLSFEIEGTNSAGDLGAAASITFQHRNVFKGSETFSLKMRGAYEAITGLQEGYDNGNYKEWGVESSLNFPEFKFPFLSSSFKRKIKASSEVGIKFNSQVRPEFTRTLASASWSYRWRDRKRSQHSFDLVDVYYIYVPWRSKDFEEYLHNLSRKNSILIKSYEDQLIVRTAYSYAYNSALDKKKMANRHTYSIRFNIEESGNLLYLASKTIHSKPKAEKGYVIANIPFAQYVKGDFDYSHNLKIDNRNSLAFHIGIGIAYPYGNSQMLPFEKRYFSGGPNSVRGWAVRSLGPGSYKSTGGSMNYINHTGDIKLDLNVEYRTHLFWKFMGAAFIDAGNIWNIREYEGQEEGTFRIKEFYKQMAVSYGLGIRLDLDYLILRFDGGMKAINPMETDKKKYPILRTDFGRDFAFHFAVGYPF